MAQPGAASRHLAAAQILPAVQMQPGTAQTLANAQVQPGTAHSQTGALHALSAVQPGQQSCWGLVHCCCRFVADHALEQGTAVEAACCLDGWLPDVGVVGGAACACRMHDAALTWGLPVGEGDAMTLLASCASAHTADQPACTMNSLVVPS